VIRVRRADLAAAEPPEPAAPTHPHHRSDSHKDTKEARYVQNNLITGAAAQP
jgi:hypothetical protein